jgi:hypothetical protein
MSYATLEEVWGPDFAKKKKSKKERKLEKQEKKMIREAVDSQILIPKMADKRATYRENIPDYKMISGNSVSGYDTLSDNLGSPYQYHKNEVEVSNQAILRNNKVLEDQSKVNISGPINNMVQLSMGEYQNLKNKVVEGFANQSDEQFNQLLLYIFAGIFYLMMLDMMYQLGKKSY